MSTEISCPTCQTKIVVEEALASAIEKDMRQKLEKDWRQRMEGLQKEKLVLSQEKELVEKQKQQQDSLLSQKLAEAKTLIEADSLKKAREESEARIRGLEEAGELKTLQIRELKDKELDLLRQKTELETLRRDMEREIEKKMLESRREIEEQATKKERELSELRILEMQKKLDDQTKLAEEMQRKAEQGSMQLQGEVQELALEALLKTAFPFDQVLEVSKGKKGADCVLVVRNSLGQECGKIVYESKRTQKFADEWIPKVKSDMQMINADLAVIVTQAMPNKMEERFGHREGVWICSFQEVGSLTVALREGLIKVYQATRTQENKGDKMQMLYNYLTGKEFSLQWEAIREGFRHMQQSIIREREMMEKIWKAREKQLEKVLINAAHIRGSIEGIAGTDAVDIHLLDNEDEGRLLL